jgi:hypothetical protein
MAVAPERYGTGIGRGFKGKKQHPGILPCRSLRGVTESIHKP